MIGLQGLDREAIRAAVLDERDGATRASCPHPASASASSIRPPAGALAVPARWRNSRRGVILGQARSGPSGRICRGGRRCSGSPSASFPGRANPCSTGWRTRAGNRGSAGASGSMVPSPSSMPPTGLHFTASDPRARCSSARTALRRHLPVGTRAFELLGASGPAVRVVLALHRARLRQMLAQRVTELGSDADAIDPQRRSERLFDLD